MGALFRGIMEGLYRGDFVRLIQRSAHPYAVLKFYNNRFGRADTMSIVDFDLPRREGFISPTQRESEWFHESYVCNVGVLGHSWVPFNNADNDRELWRGAKSTIEMLLTKRCIKETPEIRQFIKDPSNWRPS